LLNLLVRFGRWNCPCHSTTSFLQHCVIEFLNSVFQFLLRINPSLLHQEMYLWYDQDFILPFFVKKSASKLLNAPLHQISFLKFLCNWRELLQLHCALSPLQIALRIFSFLSKGFNHKNVVLSTLSHPNKTHFHICPCNFLLHLQPWGAWNFGPGCSGGQCKCKTLIMQSNPTYKTDLSPSLSIVHHIVGVSTLFAAKLTPFQGTENQCLWLCAVSTTASVDLENQAIFMDKVGTYFRHLELAQRWCHPNPWDLSMSGAALRNWTQPSCATEWESEAPLNIGKMKLRKESLKMTDFDVIKCPKFWEV
jgi:hypothetical protein